MGNMPITIPNLKDYLSRDSNGLAHSTFACPQCGQQHNVAIGEMRAARGLVVQIPEVAGQVLGRSVGKAQVVYDRAIEEIIHDRVISPLRGTGMHLSLLPIGSKGTLLDSETLLGNQLAAQVDADAEILIGAGSGVICDLTKWIATQVQRPYLILGTAPSMNGYTSITATMTEHDVKTSILLNPANAVLLDVDIMTDAPMPMIHAGVGDLAARAICNADWRLSSFIHGAYFCPLPYQMTAENERLYLGSAQGIAMRDPQSIEFLGEAILKSGLSMTILHGETSPSSGAEHIISHFWDLLTHTRHLPKNLHGMQVGIGTVIMLAFYEYMRDYDPHRVDPTKVLRQRPALETMQAENEARYGLAGPIFNSVVQSKYRPDDDLIRHIRWLQDHWRELWKALDPYVPMMHAIIVRLQQSGMPMKLSAVQRSTADAVEALVKGPQYRSRYTLLDLAWELGLLPGVAEEILDRAGVIG